jgi:hypothetical protein
MSIVIKIYSEITARTYVLLSVHLITLSRLCYVALNDRMMCELGRMWKEAAHAVTSQRASVRITGLGARLNTGTLNTKQE